MKLILASGSPRRRELLAHITTAFEVVVSDVDEHIHEVLSPEEFVAALAERKALAVAEQHPDALVIGMDTVVVLGDEILGKPADEAEAIRMLTRLSGRSHRVLTAVYLCHPQGGQGFVSSTEVQFAPLSAEEIAAYVATGEPMDKAGAYGIQGLGSRFVAGIRGDYYTVMGLPVQKLYQLLRPHLDEIGK